MVRPALALLVVLVACGSLATETRADPRADYLLHCGGCHLADGRGVPPEVPTLVAKLGPIVTSQEGRDYVVRVPGAAQTPLSDEQLAAVVNWVLTGFNADTLQTNFRPLNGSEVGKARSRVLADPQKYRQSLWPDDE